MTGYVVSPAVAQAKQKSNNKIPECRETAPTRAKCTIRKGVSNGGNSVTYNGDVGLVAGGTRGRKESKASVDKHTLLFIGQKIVRSRSKKIVFCSKITRV